MIAGAGVRVGVKGDGTVSYMNPEYWYRAYFRKDFSSKAEPAAKALQGKLQKALSNTIKRKKEKKQVFIFFC